MQCTALIGLEFVAREWGRFEGTFGDLRTFRVRLALVGRHLVAQSMMRHEFSMIARQVDG